MLQSLATQEDSIAFKKALEQVASNLAFHVASAADKAHGIEAVHGYIDGNGVDRRCYRDSYGAYISGSYPSAANFIRFVVNGVAYYAPAIYPAVDPGAQAAPPSIALSTLSSTGGLYDTALITNYSVASTITEQNLSDSLTEHTRATHQSAHIQLQVAAKTFYSPSGAILADQAVRIVWNGTIYEIPCTMTLGGPAQVSATATPMALIATPGDGTHDPADVNVQFNGIPDHDYTVTMKVRGVVILKPYDKPGWALPGQHIATSPVPPAATSPPAVFQFTGTLSPHGAVKQSDATIEWKLLLGNTSAPDAVYCLNCGSNTITWPSPLDYTFDFPLTTDSAGHATLTLTSRTIDNATTANQGRYRIDDNDPPLLPSVQTAQGTKYVWMQVDVIAAT
jgi:hypothetical protein